MHDLVKQQRITKDTLRALESLGDKNDREKREMVVRHDKEREDILKREGHKYESKVNSLKSINEQMAKKMLSFDELQEECMNLQKNYNEAIQIIDEQKRENEHVGRDNEDNKQRSNQLEDELKDV